MHRTVGIPIVTMNRDVNATSRMIADEIKVRGYTPENHLLVRSEFLTIQGEGPFAGQPAYFVRLGGCNLGSKQEYCQGCDTSFEIAQSKVVPVTELAERIMACATTSPAKPRLVVITGGEPLLQAKAIAALVEELADLDSMNEDECIEWVQLETNGILLESALTVFNCLSSDASGLLSFVVSPKASAKGYPEGLMKALGNVAEATDYVVYFKFVIDAEPESNHYTVPQTILDLARQATGLVYVSPFTVYAKPYSGEVSSVWDDGLIDKEQTAKNYRRAAELALQHPGLRVSVQTHTFLGVA